VYVCLCRCLFADVRVLVLLVLLGTAAYSHRSGTHETRYLGTDKESNVYAVELGAMDLALQIVMKAKQDPATRYRPKITTIFADIQTALKAIQNPGNRSGQHLSMGAHIGIDGHEKADQLAQTSHRLARVWPTEAASNPTTTRETTLLENTYFVTHFLCVSYSTRS
jgi:hypothetical protein